MTEPDTQIGPYKVLRQLGEGGMGQVFLAHDSRLDRDVALKMLPASLAGDSELLGLFRREALTLAALNHPNIAAIYGFEETGDGTLALVLERVEGVTLSDLLEKGPLAPKKALLLCAQIAEALEAAHERHVIHRDLKPGNVMLGPRGLVKVLDFGLAAKTGADNEAVVAGGGTIGYMSPEQVEGEEQDARTDIFAFGCVLYECLTGRRAFPGDSEMEVMTAILFSDPELEALPSTTPARVRDLLTKCLEKDPADRVASMHEIRVELEEALGIRRASALRTGEAEETPHNLPGNLSAFIGRESQLEACRKTFEATRLLSLTGVGGCGKTRLALELARRTLDDYPDGAWFVDLAATKNPAEVPSRVAKTLELPEEPGRPITDTLTDHFRDRKALLVLDNCEHLVDAARDLITTLLNAGAAHKIIVTSREALATEAETIHPVPTLTVPEPGREDPETILATESGGLFVERAGVARPGFELTAENAPAVAEICRRLDGIPLALELAAARVRVLNVDQIRKRLDDRFRLLTGGSRDALPRQQTLESTLQWSWDQLSEPEQQMMRKLSIFNGGWTLGTATAICLDGGDEFEVLDLLTLLVDKSLVMVDTRGEATRYRFLETVREYAARQLRESGDLEAVQSLHLNYFLALAEAAETHLAGSEQETWLSDLEMEHGNLLAAFARSASVDDAAGIGLRLAASLSRFWSVHGHCETGLRILHEALDRPRADSPGDARAKALVRAAGLALNLGDYGAAQPLLEESLAFHHQMKNEQGEARALLGLCVVAGYRENYDAARAWGEKALQAYRKAGRVPGTAQSLHNLGYIAQFEGDLDTAHERYEAALALYRDVGDLGLTALTLINLATVEIRAGDAAGARRRLQESLEIVQRLGSRREGSFLIEAAAELELMLGNPAQAASLCGSAAQIREEARSPLLANERRQVEALIQRINTQFGDVDFNEAMAAGKKLTFEEVLESLTSRLQES